MTSLTTDKNTPSRDEELVSYGVATAKKLFAGSIAVINASGYIQPGTIATGLIAAGRADEQVDNTTGADGAVSANVIRNKAFKWDNAGDIVQADVGKKAYITDDQTVTAVSSGKSVLGTITDVDSDGVWVFVSANKE